MLRGDNFNLDCQQSMEIVYNNRCIIPAEAAGTLIMGSATELWKYPEKATEQSRNKHGTPM